MDEYDTIVLLLDRLEQANNKIGHMELALQHSQSKIAAQAQEIMLLKAKEQQS